MSFSQFGQDLHVVNTIFNGKEGGYFVEVGASEGIWGSNTLLLEQKYGWNGICIECNPRMFDVLSQKRKCHCCSAAIYDQDDQTLQFYDANIGGHSGLAETITNPEVKTYSNVIQVQTKTLMTVLDQFKAPPFIDFLSLDTEGSEYKILQAMDFTKYKFGYICVEHNYVEPNRTLIRTLLESKGYVFYRQNEVDDDYILKELLPTSSDERKG